MQHYKSEFTTHVAALIDMAREDPDDFVAENDINVAMVAMERLVLCGQMSASDLIRCCQHHDHRDRLLTFVVKQFADGGDLSRKRIQNALLDADENMYDTRHAHLVFNEPGDQETLIAWVRESYIERHDHPLFRAFDPDVYWPYQVRKFIVRNDFSRAWDNLKRARNGFLPPGVSPLDTGHYAKGQRWGMVSKELLPKLVSELFVAMRVEGLVDDVPERMHVCSYATTTRYPKRMPINNRKPAVSHVNSKLPGWDFATVFSLEVCQETVSKLRRENLVANWRPYANLDARGLMVLSMARYFADKANEKRKTKYECLLREHESKQ